MWTGERRLLISELSFLRARETELRADCFSFGGSGEDSGGLDELWGWCEGRFDRGVGGGGRRTVPREPVGKARIRGFDVAKPARSNDPDGGRARGRKLKGGMLIVDVV